MRVFSGKRAGTYYTERIGTTPRERTCGECGAKRLGEPLMKVPAYGYLDGFRISVDRDSPNMDAANRYSVHFQLIDPDGNEVPCTVTMICEQIANA